MLFKIEIPIMNYEGNGVFYKSIYFENERCFSYDEILEILKREHEKEKEMSEELPGLGPYTFEYLSCIKSLNVLGNNNFPFLFSTWHSNSTPFTHPDFKGTVHYSIEQIIPLRK